MAFTSYYASARSNLLISSITKSVRQFQFPFHSCGSIPTSWRAPTIWHTPGPHKSRVINFSSVNSISTHRICACAIPITTRHGQDRHTKHLPSFHCKTIRHFRAQCSEAESSKYGRSSFDDTSSKRRKKELSQFTQGNFNSEKTRKRLAINVLQWKNLLLKKNKKVTDKLSAQKRRGLSVVKKNLNNKFTVKVSYRLLN